jgi:hypothetical protein
MFTRGQDGTHSGEHPQLFPWPNVTSFDICRETDINVDLARREPNGSECSSNIVHTCALAVELWLNAQVLIRLCVFHFWTSWMVREFHTQSHRRSKVV